MNTKSLKLILGITTVLLAIPFTAMFFTDEVDWSTMDFLIAATLLLGTGILINLAITRIKSNAMRIGVLAGIILTLVLVWAELAVGIFGTPLAGS